MCIIVLYLLEWNEDTIIVVFPSPLKNWERNFSRIASPSANESGNELLNFYVWLCYYTLCSI